MARPFDQGLGLPLGLSERDDFRDEGVQIGECKDVPLFDGTIEISEASDNAGGVHARGVHGAEELAGFLDIREQRGVVQEQFRVADDAHEHVIKIVGDAAGHGAEGSQALMLNDLLLGTFEFGHRGPELIRAFGEGFGAGSDAVFENPVLIPQLLLVGAHEQGIPDAHDQLGEIEWFREKLRDAAGEGLAAQLLVGIGGKDEHGNPILGTKFGPQLLHRGKPIDIHARQLEDDQIRLPFQGFRDEFRRARDSLDLLVAPCD